MAGGLVEGGRQCARTGIRLADRSESRRFTLDTGIRPVSNAHRGEQGNIPDAGVNTHQGNPGREARRPFRMVTAPTLKLVCESKMAHPGFRGATSSSINDPSRALPRLRTLWTNWKNPRYNGSRSCGTPRGGGSQLRSSAQNPPRVLTWPPQNPPPSSPRANSPAAWQPVWRV